MLRIFLFKRFSIFVYMVLAVVICSYSYAQNTSLMGINKQQDVSFKAQTLREMLTDIGRTFEVQLIYPSKLVSDINSEAVNGLFSITELLAFVLADTALDFDAIDKNTFLILPKNPSITLKEKPVILPTPLSVIKEKSVVPTELVIVTGSRLRRNQYDTPYPTSLISNNIINNDVFTSLSDVINSQPALCEPSFSINSFNPNNIGESFGDLYCLGSQRTLSLINGRRSVSSNEPVLPNSEPGLQVDLNMLPRLMIDSIEVIGVGGAPVYGSDAIAGTVNVLLKDNFEGLEFDAQSSFAQHSGAEQINLGALYGGRFLDERLNIIASYEFHKQNALFAHEREYTASNFEYVGVTPTNDNPLDIILARDATNPLLTRSGIPTPNGDDFPLFAIGDNLFANEQGAPLAFNNQGRLAPFDFGQATLDLDRNIGGDGIRDQTDRRVRIPFERHAFAFNSTFELLPNITLFSELQLYRAQFSAFGNQFPVVSSFDFGQNNNARLSLNENFNSLPLTLQYPYLNEDDAALIQSAQPDNNTFFLHKDWRDIIDPTIDVDSTIARFVLGLRGDFFIFQRQFNWDIAFNRGRSESITTSTRLNRDNFNQAIAVASQSRGGEISCVDSSNNCVPLNVLGTEQTPQAIDFVTQSFDEQGELNQTMVTASIQAPLFELNGGDLMFVTGFEAREEQSVYLPPSNYQEPRLPISAVGLRLLSDLNANVIDRFSTAEFFVEALAPVLGDGVLHGVEKIELETNWRGVNHSISGDDDAWTVGARLTFNPSWIKGRAIIRSNVTQSIRSPTLLELASPITPTNINVNDPCDRDFVNTSDNAITKQAICNEQARLLGFAYNNQTFDSLVPLVAPLSLEGTVSLRNEKAQANTTGLIYQSNFANALNFSIDYIDIDINNAIVLRDLQGVLDRCYEQNITAACNDVIRISDFQLFGISNGYQNIGEISLQAWQYVLDTSFNASNLNALFIGDINVNFSAYQLTEFLVDDANGIQNRVGQLRFPRWQANTSLSYSYNDIYLKWATFYTGKVAVSSQRSNLEAMPELDDYFLHSLYMNYAISNAVNITLGVENIFDVEPPTGLPSSDVGSTYDILGRYFSAGLKLNF